MTLQQDVERVNRKLSDIGKNQVPRAAVNAINKVARAIGKRAMKAVAKDVGVPVKTIRGRMRIEPAKRKLPIARLRINRADMPAIRLLEYRANRIWVGRGGIVIGKYAMQRGFKQRLKNGRWHILQRQGRERYPIHVTKINVGNKITQVFKAETSNYPTEIKQALALEIGRTLK